MLSLNDIPTVDLHRHLEGNINTTTICQLAQEFGVDLPSYEPNELAKHCQIQDKTSDLLAFLAKLDYGVSVLGNEIACERVAFENVKDAFEQGIDYVELRFSPNYMAKAFSLDLDKVVDAVISGIKKAQREYPIIVNLIGILSRSYGVKECDDELNAILNHKSKITALDLAGDELGFPASLFKEHFSKARAVGLEITVHAGEADGSQSIWQAIEYLGASRIGHGVAAKDDNKLLDYMRLNNIGIESCITSNYQTGTYTDTKNHPIAHFLASGVSVSLNTDDPGVSNIDIEHEYKVAREVVGLTQVQLIEIKKMGLAQAFASHSQLEQLSKAFANKKGLGIKPSL